MPENDQLRQTISKFKKKIFITKDVYERKKKKEDSWSIERTNTSLGSREKFPETP